jgi:hypothetical protein
MINILSKQDVYNYQEHKTYTHLSVWLQECFVIIGQHHPVILKFLRSLEQVFIHINHIRSLGVAYSIDNETNTPVDDANYLYFLNEMKTQTHRIWNITATWGTVPAQSLPIQHSLLTFALIDAPSYLARPECDLDLIRELYSQIKLLLDKFPTFYTFQMIANSLVLLLNHSQLDQKSKESLVHFFCNLIAPKMYRDILEQHYFLRAPQQVMSWINAVQEIQAMTQYSLGAHLKVAVSTLEDFFRSVAPDRDKIKTQLQDLRNAETLLTGNDPLWQNITIHQMVRDIRTQHFQLQKQIRELYLMLPEMIFNPEQQQAVTKNLKLIIELISHRTLFFQWKKVGIHSTLVLFVKALYSFHQLYHDKNCISLKQQLSRLYDNFIPYQQLVGSPFAFRSTQEEHSEKILKILSSVEFGRDYVKSIFTKKYERLCYMEN